jgi:hypothetical protein
MKGHDLMREQNSFLEKGLESVRLVGDLSILVGIAILGTIIEETKRVYYFLRRIPYEAVKDGPFTEYIK